MINVLRIVTWILLPVALSSACSIGTLKCVLENEIPIPKLCDFKNSYILNETLDECILSNIKDCEIMGYSVRDTLCYKCKDRFYFDTSLGECSKILIDNCLEVDDDGNCKKCDKNHFIRNDQCQEINDDGQGKAKIFNCDYYQTEDICLECETGYYLSENICKEIIQTPLCMGYRELDCLECKDDEFLTYGSNFHMLDDFEANKFPDLINILKASAFSMDYYTYPVCSMGLVDFCAKHESLQKCEVCAEGYNLTEDKTCQPVQTENSARILKANCDSLDDSNQGCNQCRPDYNLIQNKYLALYKSTLENCKEVEPLTHRCSMCDEDFYLDENDNRLCKMRKFSGPKFGCAKSVFDQDACLECSSSHLPYELFSFISTTIQCVAQSLKYTIENCRAYNLANSKCQVCEAEYRLNDDKTECIYDPKIVTIFFNEKFEIKPTRIFESISHCSVYSQIDLHSIGCALCQEGFVKIVDIQNSQFNPIQLDFLETSSGRREIGVASFSCLSEEESFEYSSNTTLGGSLKYYNRKRFVKNCAVGYFHDPSDEHFVCLRCRKGFSGITVVYNSNPPRYGIGDCNEDDDNAEVSGDFIMQEMEYFRSRVSVPVSLFLGFTSCIEQNKVLLVRGKHDNFRIHFSREFVGKKFLECIDTNENRQLISFVLNCQIFGYFSDSQTGLIGNCLACKPGFRPIYAQNSRRIESCEQIANCNESMILNGCSSPSVGFKAPSKNFDSSQQENISLVDLPSVQAGLFNCLVSSDDPSPRCLMCNSFYMLVDGRCRSIEYNDTCTKNESKSVLSINSVEESNSKIISFRLMALQKMDLRLKIEQDKCLVCMNSMVITSTQELSLVNETTCVSSGNPDSISLVTNCEEYSTITKTCAKCADDITFNENTKSCSSSILNCQSQKDGVCTRCRDGYVQKEKGGSCQSPQCQLFDGKKCLLCEDGFSSGKNSLDCDKSIPQSDKCLAYSPSLQTCVKCKVGSLVLTVDIHSGKVTEYFCDVNIVNFFTQEWQVYINEGFEFPFIQIDMLDSKIEEIYFNFLNLSTGGTIPVRHSFLTSSALTHCISKRNVQFCNPDFFYSDILCSRCETGYHLVQDKNICEETINNGCIKIDSDSKNCLHCHSDFYVSQTSSCEYKSNLDFCSLKDESGNNCLNCYNGFILNIVDNICSRRQNTAFNCIGVNSENICTICKEGYTLADNQCKICKDQVCSSCDKTQEIVGGKCISCTRFENFLNARCNENGTQIENCKVKLSKNECKFCKLGYLLNGSKDTCQIMNPSEGIENCLVPDENNETCTECKNRYWLSESKQICMANSIEGCKDQESAVSCKECEAGFNLTQDKASCFNAQIKGCKVQTSAEECEECQEGYKISEDKTECIDIKIDGCKVQNTEEICDQCEDGFELSEDKKKCTNVKIDACEVQIDANTCEKCEDGYTLAEDKSHCKLIVIDGCKVSGEKGCIECEENYVIEEVVENGETIYKCVQSGISNCLDSVGGENPMCLKCKSPLIPSSDFSSCREPSAINFCSEYYSVDQCEKCQSDFVRSLDWKRCNSVQDNNFSQNTRRCSVLVEVRELICDQCHQGFYRNEEGQCVECGNGCAFCGKMWLNNESVLQCFMCGMGYYMNEKYNCISTRSLQ